MKHFHVERRFYHTPSTLIIEDVGKDGYAEFWQAVQRRDDILAELERTGWKIISHTGMSDIGTVDKAVLDSDTEIRFTMRDCGNKRCHVNGVKAK